MGLICSNLDEKIDFCVIFTLILRKNYDFLCSSFSISWEQRKLKTLGTTYAGLSGKTKDDFGHGDARFITYMNVFSNPIANSELVERVEIDSSQNRVQYGDIFFTTSSETPEEVGMSSIWLENTPNIYLNSFCFGYRLFDKYSIDLNYLAYLLRSACTRKDLIILAQGISRYNISKNKVMEIGINIPLYKLEQQRIGNFLIQIDNLITLHQCKQFARNGVHYEMFLTQKMTASWEQRKFEYFFNERNERSGEGELISVTINSGIKRFSELNRFDSKPEDMSNYKVVKENDIAYNSMRMWQGASGLSPYNGILSPAYTVITPKIGVSSLFFAYQIKKPEMIHQFEIHSQGLTKDTWSLKFLPFSQIDTSAPKEYNEQCKIGTVFFNIDKLITLHQCKCQAYLSTYSGEKYVDCIVKKTITWEQRKLCDCNTVFTDGNYGEAYPKQSDMTDSLSGIPFLTGGNLKDGRLCLDGASYITKRKHMELTSGHLVEDDIVIAVRGSLGALGYVNSYNSGWNINSQLAILRTNKVVLSGKYLLQFLLSGLGQNELLKRQTGSALKQLPICSIKEVCIPITNIKEQSRIGNIFSNLDNLITLHLRL